MKIESLKEVLLTDIDLENHWTKFSMDVCPEKLLDSVKEIGIRHPISICSEIKPYKIISGHKRVQAAIKAGLTHIPAFLFPDMKDALVLNLKENFSVRHYSDIEKGCILNKLVLEGIQEDIIIDLYMPLLELERSKKKFQNLVSVAKIEPALQKLLHSFKVPATVFQVFYLWTTEDQKVAEYFNIRLSDMSSPRRARAVARPRQIAMYLSKQLTSKSLPDIGRTFGGRDHTTVMHAVNRIEELSIEDSLLADDIELLKRTLDS